MSDENYLPVPPIFKLVQKNLSMKINNLIKIRNSSLYQLQNVLVDVLTLENENISFNATKYLTYLNGRKKEPEKIIQKLVNYCTLKDVPQSCLILGRIFEFGSYNQSANLSLSYFFYNRVSSLHDNSANSILSFFHRYFFDDVPLSIVESDFSDDYFDSVLSKSHQNEHGFLRPLSCPASYKHLAELAKIYNDMFFSYPNAYLDRSRMNAFLSKNGTLDEKESYLLAMYLLTFPYPTNYEIKRAKDLLKIAFEKGITKAAAPLAKIFHSALFNDLNLTHSLFLLEPALFIKDPEAMLLSSEYMSDFQGLLKSNSAIANLKHAADTEYPPAIHKLGEFTYLGLLGIPRSAKNGFSLFLKSASNGYRPSMLEAAQQLFAGDGVLVDCRMALTLLKRVVDIGPWSFFYDIYIEKKDSKIALLHMLDLGLAPAKWIDLSEPKNYFHISKIEQNSIFNLNHSFSFDPNSNSHNHEHFNSLIKHEYQHQNGGESESHHEKIIYSTNNELIDNTNYESNNNTNYSNNNTNYKPNNNNNNNNIANNECNNTTNECNNNTNNEYNNYTNKEYNNNTYNEFNNSANIEFNNETNKGYYENDDKNNTDFSENEKDGNGRNSDNSNCKFEIIRELLALRGPLPFAHYDGGSLRRVREAREGNESSIVWLAMNTHVGDALKWASRLEVISPDNANLVSILNIWIALKGAFDYVAGKLTDEEKAVVRRMWGTLGNDALLIVATAALIMFVVLRINIFLSGKIIY